MVSTSVLARLGGFSGGKDSITILQLCTLVRLQMVMRPWLGTTSRRAEVSFHAYMKSVQHSLCLYTWKLALSVDRKGNDKLCSG